ncbi:MAG: hypothetical protein ACR2QC_08685 [Gammaproteobacteria bacterium]
MRFRARRFRLSPEWRILIKRLKVPPFRRKPESLFPLIFRFNHPSHSCEGRNLHAEGANCRRRRYNYPPLCGGGDSCLRRNGTGGEARMAKFPQKILPEKKSQKNEISAFFALSLAIIAFLLHSKGAFHDENFAPPPPCDSLILRILCAFAVLLAAAFGATSAANAQEAEAQVYSIPTDTFTVSGRTVNLGEPLLSIIASVAGDPVNFGALANVVNRIDPLTGNTVGPETGGLQNGLPVFLGTVAAKGHVLRIRLAAGVDSTVRVYDADGTLAVAAGELPTVRKTTSDRVASEFFLLATNSVWMTTTVAVRGAQGYLEPTCGGDTPRLSADGSICEATDATEAASDSAPGGDGNARDLAVIGLGVGVVGFMAAYLSGGDFSLFNFAPDYGYSLTESGYSVNTGGRLDFHKDNWHLYSAVGQENANGKFGDFRYESGGEYTADFWTAAFSETVQGETADYRFSLSADYKGGIWKVSPTYRLHSHFADEEFETQNSLNLRGVLRYNRWTISPSAGFRWESADEFGDNARFNLSAVRRF